MVESSAPITAFFDVGGVIVNSHPSAQHIASLIGDGRQSLVNFVDQAMWAHRDGYDAGASDRDFWDRVAGDCGKPAVTDELLETLVEYDSMRVHQPVPETIELLKDLHAQGIRLGILSRASLFPVTPRAASPIDQSTELPLKRWGSRLRKRSSSMTGRRTSERPSCLAFAESCGRMPNSRAVISLTSECSLKPFCSSRVCNRKS